MYCHVQQVGLAAETLELVGISQQGEHAVADQVARCFVAGHEQENQGCHQFCVCQAVACLFPRPRGRWSGRPVVCAAVCAMMSLEVRFQFHPRLPRPFDVFLVEDRVRC